MFAVKRIASAIVLLCGLLTIIFLIAHLAPGDPVGKVLSPTIPASVASELRHQFGLDQSLIVQYCRWFQNALTGNLGISFSHFRPVTEVILDFFPNTALLALTAICVELVLGVLLGLLSVRSQSAKVRNLLSQVGLIIYTLPSFWIGIVLLAIFSYGLGIFPSSQMHSVEAEGMPMMGRTVDVLKHLILPALTIAIPGTGAIARYFRASLLNIQQEEYVVYAQSLGMSRRKIFFSYELLNAATPVISILGLEIGTLLAGALVTETIFAWPGMGRLMVMAIFARDYPLIMGCALISGIVVILGNFIADMLYSVANPRARIDS